jgi:hypothetical protein
MPAEPKATDQSGSAPTNSSIEVLDKIFFFQNQNGKSYDRAVGQTSTQRK